MIEIMIAVLIIGLLAAMAIPAFTRMKETSRAVAFVNDLRIASDAFNTYAATEGIWPPDAEGTLPAEIDGYLKLDLWNGATPLGGSWDWDVDKFGAAAGISVHQPTANITTMEMVDKRIDDGNLGTGTFRTRADGFIFIIEFPPVVEEEV
ncbi:type II secretion system GspH family protein [Opitutaceae bacterium LMO-CP1]|uniref:type II secretion system protein n=1 Tax=Synoicihabitans lomoniglobus TaxID=2909285 RepID=UPI00305B87FC|nr:type II secretion system GspH family protein [Opitutaceae bacterium LMO-M01]